MKKFTTILMLLMLSMGAWAVGESLTYSISKTTGAFNAGSGPWFHTWTSNEGITPAVTLVRKSGANDMQWDGDKFKFHANGGLDYIITMPAEFTIDKLEATFSDGTARESYVTINGVQKRINAGQTITLTFDGLSGNTVTMNLNHLANTAANRFMRTPEIILTYHEKGAVENVTFNVVNANNNILATKVVEMEVGYQVTDIPQDMKRDFTTYTSTPMTVTEGGENVFTATATFNLPFIPFTNFADATWYYMTIRSNKYVQMADTEPYATTTTNGETDAYQWAFSGNPYTGVKVYNKAAGSGKNLTKDGSNPVMRDGEYSWTILSNSDGFILQETGSANNYVNEVNGTIGFWNSTLGRTDDGGTFRLTKVPEAPVTYITALENLSNDKVYTVHNTPRAMWMFTEKALAADPLSGVNIYDEVANPAAKHQIAIVKQNSKYYLYSVAQKKYLAAGNKLYKSPLEAIEIIESTDKNGNYMWFFRFEGYTDRNINTNGESKIEINWWSSHDNGNTNAIMETNATYTVDDALAAFTDYTQCVTDYRDYKGVTTDFVNNFGKLGYPKADTEATTAFLAILDRNASGTNTAEDFNTFMEKYNAAMAAENMKMPEVGMFLRLKGVAGGRYMQSTASTNATGGRQGLRLGATETADASTIFYLDTDNKLLGFTNGLYVTNTCDITSVGSNVANATQFTFVFREMGKFAVKNGGTFLYSWDGTENYCVDRQGSDHANCVIALEEVTELPITMNAVGDKSYATFYSPVAISQVDDAEVYVVNQTKDNSVVIKKATAQAIPAGKGVMLVSDAKNTSATLTIGEAEDFETGLNGVTASQQIEKGSDPYNSNLFLSKKDGKIGFYKIKTTDNVGVTGGFKAYLENSTEFGGAKEGLELEFAGVTGIENIEHGTLNMDNGAVYNLQGQKVNKAQKGVYIQNGKKVVLK